MYSLSSFIILRFVYVIACVRISFLFIASGIVFHRVNMIPFYQVLSTCQTRSQWVESANWVLIPKLVWKKCCDLHLTAEVIKRLSFSQLTQLVNARVRIWTYVWLQNSLAPLDVCSVHNKNRKEFYLSQTKDQPRSHLSRLLWEAARERQGFQHSFYILKEQKTLNKSGLHFFSGSK